MLMLRLVFWFFSLKTRLQGGPDASVAVDCRYGDQLP